MQRYNAVVADLTGAPVDGVTVKVFVAGTVTFATIYSDNGQTVKLNPFTNETTGSFDFYAANGRYDVVLEKTGHPFDGTKTRDIVLFDPFGAGSAIQSPESFRGLHLRTHPDNDKAASQILLVHADVIVMDDGVSVPDWNNLVADLSVVGAGGRDMGSEEASTWYELYAIRKSSDGTKGLLLHRAKDYFLDQSFTSVDTSRALRLATSTPTDKIAQGFQVATAGKVEFVDVAIIKQGTVPISNVWVTIETDSAGSPSGIVLATSDKMDASKFGATSGGPLSRFVFRSPATLSTSTQYHLVLQADYARSDVNTLNWSGLVAGGYANGASKDFNGTTWSATPGASGLDRDFKIYVTRNDLAVTPPPGYDQRTKLSAGFFNNSGSDLKGLIYYDRKAQPLSDQTIGNVTGATIVLQDISTFIPPGRVRIQLGGVSSLAGLSGAGVGPVPDGFIMNASVAGGTGLRKGGSTRLVHSFSIGLPDGESLEFGFVLTEFQAIYFAVGAATWQISISEWEW